MENISFVLWMVGWPFAVSIKYHFRAQRNETSSPSVQTMAALIEIAIWIVVGNMLYVVRK